MAVKALILLSLPTLASAAFNYWDPEDTATIPKLLSQTGFYTAGTISTNNKVVVGTAHHYDVNSILWSDGAKKMRWFQLKSNKSVGFKLNDDYWTYPDSMVFIKQFAIDTIPGDTTSRVLWETRFLVNKKVLDISVTPNVKQDYWYGITYKWDADQKEARLVSDRGLHDSIRVYPNGKNQPYVWKKWAFPKRSDCEQCHQPGTGGSLHARSVLGFFTAQLNRPHPDSAAINQLQYFFNKNYLSGTKPSNWNAPSVPRWAAIENTSASIDLRARSYIAANCSGCHGARGYDNGATQGVDLNYDYHTMESQMEFRHRSVGWPFDLDKVAPFYYNTTSDSIANPYRWDSLPIEPALTVPGYPSKSVLLFRQLARDTIPGNYDTDNNQMPPLASYEVNVPATDLIRQWILEMVPIPAPNISGIRSFSGHTLLKSPIIEGHVLRLPPELAGSGNVKVSMTGIGGRTMELKRTGPAVYAIPANLTSGVYMIRVGGKSFTRYFF